MFFGNKRRMLGLVLAGCLLFTTEFEVFAANPQSEAQAIVTVNYENMESPLTAIWKEIPTLVSVATNTQDWYRKALANTDTEMDVYAEANGAVIAKMYKNTIVNIEEEGEEWSKISSGSIVGYVRNDMLLYGSAAVDRAAITCAQGTQDAKSLEQIHAEQKQANEIRLLAALIFCEAGNQCYDGKVAVGSVVMNRINSSRYPNTLEKVIYQRGQFTPAMTGKLARVLSSGNIPSSCFDAARDAMNGAKPVGNALYFNTGYGRLKLGDHYFS